LLGAAGLHIAVISEHFGEWPPAGWFFVGLSIVEVAAAVLVWSARPQMTSLIIALSLGTVVLWAVSRTVGLPFGPEPWTAEEIGALDIAATLLEAVTAVVLTLELLAWRRGATRELAGARAAARAA